MVRESARLPLLIVEDSESFRDLYMEAFEDSFDITMVGDKEAAFQYLRSGNEYAVALLDLRLEDSVATNVGGLEIARLISVLSALTQIIIKSGYLDKDDPVYTEITKLKIFRIVDKSARHQATDLMDVVFEAAQRYRELRDYERP